jgi:hypothetical protein
LINTICENALLSGYAKHAPTVTSEIIEAVAHDLRLGVVAVDQRSDNGTVELSQEEEERTELLRAVKTLLEARERMHADTKGRLQ